MWLLSTSRAELHYFPSPEAVPEGYAILSHVWGQISEEQTFQDVQQAQWMANISSKYHTIRLILRYTSTLHIISLGVNPRDLVSHKIRKFCITAEKYGYRWAWVDTCCIDKTSSAELSEGINSMFRYYSLSQVVYAVYTVFLIVLLTLR